MVTLYDKVTRIPGLGPTAAKKLASTGVKSVKDLLYYVPYRYEDYSQVKPIAHLVAGESVTVKARLQTIEARRSFKSKIMVTEAVVADDSGELTVKWFNQPYLAKSLREGMLLSLSGTVDKRGDFVLVNPRHERVASPDEETLVTGRMLPIYSRVSGIGEKRFRSIMEVALTALERMEDPLPESIRKAQGFPLLSEALRSVHIPTTWSELEPALNRLKFDELFLHQLLFAQVKQDRKEQSAHTFPIQETLLKEFVAELPFEMTPGQKAAAWEIVQDLAKPHPMNRLLEGDVGSGKTVVATMAAHTVLAAEGQVAYLAPTEILAIQQYTMLQSFLNASQVALLTRTRCELGGEAIDREVLRARVQSGEGLIVVGTHAVLQRDWKDIAFDFVIVDEQHRFGVRQRHELLSERDPAPHLLSMSATPIPRSLALTVYGDLDLSVIKHLPSGRRPIQTEIVTDRRENDMYAHIRAEVEKGNRVYVICPLIDPSDKVGSTSVKEMVTQLKKGPLKGLGIAALHGRMKSAEKDAIMQGFASGETPILVSTTVVEVGVDVPEATVIVIEGAERFGLAQLHQLRGRVGRSDRPSWCFLRASSDVGKESMRRLEALVQSRNGFELAEKDLELRGPGNIFGDAQSGFPDFQFATLSDVALMKRAQDAATELLERDGTLEEHPNLRAHLERVLSDVHLE